MSRGFAERPVMSLLARGVVALTGVVTMLGTLTLVTAGTAFAATLTVCPSGCSYATIQSAINAASSGDTIDIGGGTYPENLTIDKSLTLAAVSAATVEPTGGTVVAVNGGTATVQGLTISGGTNTGVVVASGATLTVTGSTISGNAGVLGGGIDNSGTLTVTNSYLTTNSAISGGGILNFGGTATVGGSYILNNTATFSGGGIDSGGSLTMTSSSIAGNTAAQLGGGLLVATGSATVSDSTFNANTATSESGGGIQNNATLTVTDSTLSGNSAPYGGGGIESAGTLTLDNSTLYGNSASAGGGFYNNPGQGDAGVVNVTNSTISGNSAAAGDDTGGGGIATEAAGGAATTTLTNTIVAGNTDPYGAPDCGGFTTSGPGGHNLIGNDSNGQYDCVARGTTPPGNQLGTPAAPIDPKLGPLTFNGGPTQTEALLSGSPALGAGDEATCMAAPIDNLDQRNYTRPDPCSIGAWDDGTPPPQSQTIAFTSTPPANAAVGGSYTVTATGGASGNPVTFSSGSPTVCTVSATGAVSFTGAGSCVIDANQAGNANYAPALQAAQSVTVGQAAQSITFTSTPPTNAAVGGSYTVTATGGASGNPVTFSSGSPTVCTVSATGAVSFTGAGSCVIDADQAGNANYAPAPQVAQSVTVGQAAQSITFTSTPPTNAVVGGSYTVTATGGASGNPVTFSSGSPTVCTVSAAGAVSFTGAGSCVIDADQAGNANYTPAPQAAQRVTVVAPKPSADLALTISAPATVGARSFQVTITVTNNGPTASNAVYSGLAVPNGLTVTSAPGGTVVANGHAVGYYASALAAGQSITYFATVNPNRGNDGTRQIGAATGSTKTPDPNLRNNYGATTVKIR